MKEKNKRDIRTEENCAEKEKNGKTTSHQDNGLETNEMEARLTVMRSE